MSEKSNQNTHHITTDDLAFSAYLKLKGLPLIKSNQSGSKSLFTFSVKREALSQLKMKFVNSEFIRYYNEIKNLKKLMEL